MAAAYVDRSNKKISAAQWKKLIKDTAYCLVKCYSNGRFYCKVQWEGRVDDAQHIPSAHWPVYRVVGGDIIEGKEAKPTINATFGICCEAVKRYEDVLVNWTHSRRDADGRFEEADNLFEPPPPPQSVEDRPSEATAANPDFGSW